MAAVLLAESALVLSPAQSSPAPPANDPQAYNLVASDVRQHQDVRLQNGIQCGDVVVFHQALRRRP